MPWSDPRALALFDEDAFLARYCSAVTRDRLGGCDVGLVRAILRRISVRLNLAHTTPGWNETGPQALVACARPAFRRNRCGGITSVLLPPYFGLCVQNQSVYLWADPKTADASGSTDWHDWRESSEGGGGIRLRFGQSLTREGDPADPLAAGQPLCRMLDNFPAGVDAGMIARNVEEIFEQARVDIDELDGLPEAPGGSRRFLDVIYPRLAARAAGRPEEEGMGPGDGGGRGGRGGPGGGGRLGRRARGRGAATPIPPAPRVAASSAVRLAVQRFDLHDVVAIAPSDRPGRSGVAFLNLRFSPAGYPRLEELRGAGVYGVFVGPVEGQRHLAYVGSYRGRKGDPFGGNVAEDRWWTHAASLTMRGDRISIARRTAGWAKARGAGDPFFALADKPALLVDAGCSAGLNRVRFAYRHWNNFAAASCSDISSFFEIAYLRLLPGAGLSPLGAHDRGGLSRDILNAEQDLIRLLLPACNYQVNADFASEGVMPDEFVRAASRVLGDHLQSEAA